MSEGKALLQTMALPPRSPVLCHLRMPLQTLGEKRLAPSTVSTFRPSQNTECAPVICSFPRSIAHPNGARHHRYIRHSAHNASSRHGLDCQSCKSCLRVDDDLRRHGPSKQPDHPDRRRGEIVFGNSITDVPKTWTSRELRGNSTVESRLQGVGVNHIRIDLTQPPRQSQGVQKSRERRSQLGHASARSVTPELSRSWVQWENLNSCASSFQQRDEGSVLGEDDMDLAPDIASISRRIANSPPESAAVCPITVTRISRPSAGLSAPTPLRSMIVPAPSGTAPSASVRPRSTSISRRSSDIQPKWVLQSFHLSAASNRSGESYSPLPGGTSRISDSDPTASRNPPTSDAITGVPHARDPRVVSPNPSSPNEGTTERSAAW